MPAGQSIGDDAIDVVQHVASAGAQARFDVPDRNAGARCGQRRGQRRVGVAVHEHEIRPPFAQAPVHARQDLRGLLRMGAGAGAQILVRVRDPQLAENRLRHVHVVVLSGVDERLTHELAAERGHHRRELHEIGAAPTTWRTCIGLPRAGECVGGDDAESRPLHRAPAARSSGRAVTRRMNGQCTDDREQHGVARASAG